MNAVLPISGRKAGELCRLLEERGVGDQEFQTKLVEGVNELVVWMRGGGQQVYPFIVDYSQSLKEMIAAGKYGYANENITSSNFPFKGKGKIELEAQLVHFGKFMSSEAVLVELDKMGLRPATLPELLAFGATHSEEQRKYPVVALGSVWQSPSGYRGVPALWVDGSGRYLGLSWFEYDWYEYDRFLAVRK